MVIQKTEGIILKGRVIGESDFIAEIFTLDHGKRSYVFKGIKKSKKRSVSITEIGTVAEITCYFKDSNKSSIVKEFNIISTPRSIRNDIDLFFYMSYILELILKTTAHENEHSFLYKMLKKVITLLENDRTPALLVLSFIIHLINYHGIFPDISRCDKCGKHDFYFFEFSLQDKALYCDSCAKLSKTGGRLLPSLYRDLFHEISVNRYGEIQKNEIEISEIEKLIFYLSLFIEDYFHIIINSKDFILKNS